MTDRERERRQRLARELSRIIAEHGGWVVSVPGHAILRFEARIGSPLPELLRKEGYALRDLGRNTRLVHDAVEEFTLTSRSTMKSPREGFAPVEVFEIKLPGN